MAKYPMPKNFDAAEVEPRLYDWWQNNGWFKPEVAGDDAQPYTISMPPPNVTGALHIGHALYIIQDVIIRYERMCGKAALWVPGADHAGIATQLQVEKMLLDEGTSREDVGREAFLERVWDWKRQYGGTITTQLRRLGVSCDWDRERFTLDDGLSESVQEVFIRLYEEGLIYRGPRLVNWSPGLQTAVSDLEVERAEESGRLYYFRYPVEGGSFLPVATTRPETILGDTAVCVHPEDGRYKHFVGKKAFVPILNRVIPIIADEYVDREFGTGALKITPAHDFNDYEIGQRHNLELVNVMTHKATLNENGGRYVGMDRFEARKALWADMEAEGMTIKVEDYCHVVPRSQRGGEVIEPLISTQWFLKIQPLADRAIDAVRSGDIKIVPDRPFEKIYFNWMENIQDWCISRQLWWGHRIPAWYNQGGEIYVGREAPEGDDWMPEDDVLDTWFSSGLWPFSTLGWPGDTPDLRRFYPTDLLETGHDILFFWVARMIMMGLWFTDEVPFRTVYLHGLIRDAEGRKISKTLGNTIDPLDLIEQYGADPLRFTLMTSGTPGNDINLDVKRVEGEYRFVNKIWQMTNFVHRNLPESFTLALPKTGDLDLPSRWILSRLNRLVGDVQRLFDAYQYGEAARQIRSFVWDEYADWYIEISKEALYGDDDGLKVRILHVLLRVLEVCLRLLHPYMPFVTEEARRYILPDEEKPLIIASWPKCDVGYISREVEVQMALLVDLVRGVRNVRNEYSVDPGRKIKLVISAGRYQGLLGEYQFMFGRLCNAPDVVFVESILPDQQGASVVVGDVTVLLPLTDLVDIEVECIRLRRERDDIESQLQRTSKMLANENFVSRAAAKVVQRERDRLVELQRSVLRLDRRIRELCGV